MDTLPDNKRKNVVKKVKKQSIRDGLVCMHLLMKYSRNMSVYRDIHCMKEGQVVL